MIKVCNIVRTSGLVCIALAMSVPSAFAENKPDNPWTDCGIGYALFKNSEVGAAISNVIWDAGTTATTTYLSTPENCRERNGEVAQFVGESYEQLEKETAVGEGEHLTAMLDIANCEANSHSDLVSSIRKDFASLSQAVDFETMDRQAKAGAFYSIVEENMQGEFKSACPIS